MLPLSEKIGNKTGLCQFPLTSKPPAADRCGKAEKALSVFAQPLPHARGTRTVQRECHPQKEEKTNSSRKTIEKRKADWAGEPDTGSLKKTKTKTG